MKESSDDKQECDTRYKNYLADLGFLTKERALISRKERDEKDRDSRDYLFESGYLMVFHYIIGLMQQQAEAFGIPLEDLRLEDIDPDKDLL
jgi:hypothetical protein